MRTLVRLTEHRRELVGDKTRFTNRLNNTVKQYYPQILDWFEQRDTVLFFDFLTRWPSLAHAKRARLDSLKAFFNAHNGRRSTIVEARLESIRVAMPLSTFTGNMES